MFSILLIGLVAVLGMLVVSEFRQSMSSIRAERWRRTTGSLADGAQSPATKGVYQLANLEYSYEVEGQSFTASRIGFGFPHQLAQYVGQATADQLLAEAPDVTVYYDPRKPQESVLLTGYQWFHVARLLPLLVLLLWASFAAFY